MGKPVVNEGAARAEAYRQLLTKIKATPGNQLISFIQGLEGDLGVVSQDFANYVHSQEAYEDGVTAQDMIDIAIAAVDEYESDAAIRHRLLATLEGNALEQNNQSLFEQLLTAENLVIFLNLIDPSIAKNSELLYEPEDLRREVVAKIQVLPLSEAEKQASIDHFDAIQLDSADANIDDETAFDENNTLYAQLLSCETIHAINEVLYKGCMPGRDESQVALFIDIIRGELRAKEMPADKIDNILNHIRRLYGNIKAIYDAHGITDDNDNDNDNDDNDAAQAAAKNTGTGLTPAVQTMSLALHTRVIAARIPVFCDFPLPYKNSINVNDLLMNLMSINTLSDIYDAVFGSDSLLGGDFKLAFSQRYPDIAMDAKGATLEAVTTLSEELERVLKELKVDDATVNGLLDTIKDQGRRELGKMRKTS